MSLAPRNNTLSVFKIVNDKESEVDFSRFNAADFFRNDIFRVRITGRIPPLPNLHLANFIESTLHDILAEDVNFAECDFKDTLVKDATLMGCKFDNGTFATSFFSSCTFANCTFYNTAAHSCEFHRVRFRQCNLTNFLIKSSRFIDCEFTSCETSNKLIEMSTFDQTHLTDTDIQLDTITSNFGLTSSDLSNSNIRSGRIRENHTFLTLADIENQLQLDRWSPIEKLRLEFFLRHDLILGSKFLDQALDLTRWTQVYSNPGSFVELLEGFSEFLTHLYASGRLTAHSVLLFHYVTSKLTEILPQGEDFHRLALALGGTHVVLSRIVEEYLSTLQTILEESGNRLTFLVEGPVDVKYFEEVLSPWFDPASMSISRLVQHNSPLELGIIAQNLKALIPLIAIFLATRTKIELLRIRERSNTDQSNSKSLLDIQKAETLLAVRTGITSENPKHFEIQVQALLPGSLLLDLRLQVGTQLAGKIRKTIIDLLSTTS